MTVKYTQYTQSNHRKYGDYVLCDNGEYVLGWLAYENNRLIQMKNEDVYIPAQERDYSEQVRYIRENGNLSDKIKEWIYLFCHLDPFSAAFISAILIGLFIFSVIFISLMVSENHNKKIDDYANYTIVANGNEYWVDDYTINGNYLCADNYYLNYQYYDTELIISGNYNIEVYENILKWRN